jgi:hypothetical protein
MSLVKIFSGSSKIFKDLPKFFGDKDLSGIDPLKIFKDLAKIPLNKLCYA